MNKIKKLFKNNFLLIILSAVSSIAYFRWINFSIFINGDWGFDYYEGLSATITPYLWKSAQLFGYVDITPFRAPIIFLISLISHTFEVNSNVTDKFFYFWPIIILLPVSSFLLLKELTRNNLAAFVGSVVFCFNTYYLTIDTVGHNLITISSAYCLLGLYFIFKLIHNNVQKSNVVFACIFLTLGGYYDFRILYLCFGIVVLIIPYFLRHKDIKTTFLIYITIFSLILFLNLFWLIPLLLTTSNSEINVLARPLFGDQFWSLSNAITLFHPFWNGDKPEWFINQDIPTHFWLIPILVTISIITLRKNLLIRLFFILGVVGIFLSKQSDEPFKSVYQWLYLNFPGFNAFREASKFYFYICLSYSVLIAFLIQNIIKDIKSNLLKVIIIFPVVGIFLWNTVPMITGSIQTMFAPRELNSDYQIIRKIINNDNNFSRILWIPVSSPFSINSLVHPKVSINSLFGLQVTEDIRNRFKDNETESKVNYILDTSYANFIFKSSSIKYVSVPLVSNEFDNTLYNDYGGKNNKKIYNWYAELANKVSWLKKINTGTKDLVVYENENYRPHIDSVTSLVRLDSFKNLDDKYSFILDRYKRDTDFYMNTSSGTVPSDHLSLLYEDTNVSTIYYDNINKWLKESHETTSDTKLYINNSPATTYFIPDIDSYKIVRSYVTGLQVDGQPLWKPDTETVYSSSRTLFPAYLQVGTQIVQTNKNSSTAMMLGSTDLPIELLLKIEDSIIPNGSFESGLWEGKVGDCNNYDNNGQLAQRLVRDNRDNGMSLELEATRHTACTGQKSIRVTEGDEYILSLDYQSDNAKVAGYYISMIGATTTVIFDRLPIASANWSTYQKRIVIPEKVKDISFTLYSFEDDGITPIKVRYDNVRLEKVLSIKKIDPSKKVTFRPVDKTLRGTTIFMMSDPNTTLNNLIPNPNFYNELWSKSVGDCNNYDKNGELAQYHVDDARDGGKSLELEATRHTACTGPGLIPVAEGATYLLSFDYQSLNSQPVGYNISWSGTTTQAISEQIPVKDAAWHTFTKHMTVPYGATAASLSVYAYEKDGTTPVKVRYDNFYLTKLPEINNRYYLLNEKKLDLEKPESITFDLVNPTKKLVHVHGATTPFYLTMSESFHPQWQAQLNNSKVVGTLNSWVPWVTPDAVPDDYHFKLDGFLNGWYIDPTELCRVEGQKSEGQKVNTKSGCNINADGSYDIELVIEFVPQRWFYVGLLISGTTLLSCLGYLGYDFVRRRRSKAITSKREITNAWD